MKKILVAAVHLDYGGIEKSLINLLKVLNPKDYQVTLLLQEKKGVFMSEVPSYVKVREYKISENKNPFFRKIYNRLHLLFHIFFSFHHYDTAVCYATYDIPSSLITKKVGKRSVFWIHSNYTYIYPKEEDLRNFFDTRGIEKFNQIVFVSNESKKDLLSYYPSIEKKSVAINNLFDFKEIEEKAKEKVILKKDSFNLVFVGRLEEKSKALIRLLKVMQNFENENKKIHLWIVGTGPDENQYKEFVTTQNIENVTFLGQKKILIHI